LQLYAASGKEKFNVSATTRYHASVSRFTMKGLMRMAPVSKPNPSPFFLDGGPVGVLLIHGFTGAPPEMRLIGDYLNQQGLTVSAPLLPGHGTFVSDMNQYTWRSWVDHAAKSLAELRLSCKEIFIGGLSMGSLIALQLAHERDFLKGIILYSPAIRLASRLIYFSPIAKYFMSSMKKERGYYVDPASEQYSWSYDEHPVRAGHELLVLIRQVEKILLKVTCPALLIQSAKDPVIQANSGRIIFNSIGSKDKEIMMLNNSGHRVTIDADWKQVSEKTYEFILKRSEG
jgi:carboxylesterase